MVRPKKKTYNLYHSDSSSRHRSRWEPIQHHLHIILSFLRSLRDSLDNGRQTLRCESCSRYRHDCLECHHAVHRLHSNLSSGDCRESASWSFRGWTGAFDRVYHQHNLGKRATEQESRYHIRGELPFRSIWWFNCCEYRPFSMIVPTCLDAKAYHMILQWFLRHPRCKNARCF